MMAMKNVLKRATSKVAAAKKKQKKETKPKKGSKSAKAKAKAKSKSKSKSKSKKTEIQCEAQTAAVQQTSAETPALTQKSKNPKCKNGKGEDGPKEAKPSKKSKKEIQDEGGPGKRPVPEGMDPSKKRSENRKLVTSRAYHQAADAH